MRFGELGADVTGTGDHRPPVVLLHGLTFDRHMWAPMVRELSGRRVLALDLPGHGDSLRRNSYDLNEVVEVLHDALRIADVERPVMVGHSVGGLLATMYAGNHPTRAVLNIDQPLLPGPFGEYLRSVEAVLRGPDHLSIWVKLLAGMGTEQLAPQHRRLLRTKPRQDILLGYWKEILETSPAILRERRAQQLTAVRGAGTAYHYVSRSVVAADYAEWFLEMLPEAGITVLPGNGHFPHVAQPAALAAILSGWE
ncbi:MAG: alpha/beta hydrolase [Mycobacterium sp.]